MTLVAPPVEIVSSDGLTHAVVRSTCRGIPYATLVLKATFTWAPNGERRSVDPDPVALWDTARSRDPRSSLAVASETAPYLSQAAVVCSGFAHPPKHASSGTFGVRFALMAGTRALIDKHLVAASDGAPVPLAYEEALATAENPAGTARPRLSDPRHPGEAVGFGPISSAWPLRARYLQGGRPPQYLQPGAGLDLGPGVDARYFNPAPLDQQPPFLDGNESLIFEGMDEEGARPTVALGGVSADVFLTSWKEDRIPLHPALDMVIVDAGRRRFSLVWRTMLPFSPPASQFEGLAVEAALRVRAERTTAPPAAMPTPSEPRVGEATSELIASPSSGVPFIHVAPPESVDPPARDPRHFRTMETNAPTIPTTLPFVKTPALAREPAPHVPATPYDEAFDPHTIDAPDTGAGTRIIPPPDPIPPSATPITVEPATVAREARPEKAIAEPPRASPEAPPPQATPAPPATPAQPAQPTDRGDARRRAVLERMRDGGTLRDMDLTEADLSDLDLSGQSFSGSRLDRANLSKTNLRGAKFPGVSMNGAKLEDATLDESDLEGASLRGAQLTGASLTKANLQRANLTNATARKVSFAGVRADEAVFADSELEGAIFKEASLHRADLTRARARGADFASANLRGSILSQTEAPSADFSRCDLDGATCERAALTDAKLDHVSASDVNFERASLVRARFNSATLARGRFGKASLDEAKFDAADLRGADFTQAVGLDASFREANLEHANLRQCRMEGAVFTKANLAEANLARATLGRASFDEASLRGADARATRFVDGSFLRASLDGADLRDADLTGAQLDGATKVDAKLKGAKLPTAAGKE